MCHSKGKFIKVSGDDEYHSKIPKDKINRDIRGIQLDHIKEN